MRVDTHTEFEDLAKRFLSRAGLPHEWRQIQDKVGGSRTDLVVFPDSEREMFASLRDSQITIGDSDTAEDFEDFGRGVSDYALAKEAFERFESLLRQHLEADA